MEADRIIRFGVVIAVTDREAMQAFARTLNPGLDGSNSLEDAIAEVVSNPEKAPLDTGYEVLRRTVAQKGETAEGAQVFSVVTEVEILDPALLAREARRRYKICWQETAPRMTIAEQLYEVTLASNASPSPCDIGIEIVDRDLGLDRHAARRARLGRPVVDTRASGG